MRLFVIGGSGFLGGFVLRAAARQGHETFALVRSQAAAQAVSAAGAVPVPGDLDQSASLDEAVRAQPCDALVCLASLGYGHGARIVAAAEEAGLARGVFVSTTSVTTTLDPPTKQVRLAAEREVMSSALAWTVLRPTMIYGAPGDRNLARLLRLLAHTPVLPLPGSSSLHQPVHVGDVASAVLAAVARPASAGRRYDVAGPEALRFAEVVRHCADAVGAKTKLLPVPLGAAVLAARGYQALSRHPRLTLEQVRRLAEDKAFPIEAAARDLGYQPRPFRDGIRAEAHALGLAA